MDALQLGDVIGIGNAHWAEILGEPSQALFGDGMRISSTRSM